MAKIGIIVTLMVFIVILSLCATGTLLTTLIPLGKEIRYKND